MAQENTLVLASGLGDETREACHRLLTDADVEATCFVVVNYTQSGERWLSEFEAATGERPWGTIFVALSGATRTGTRGRPSLGEMDDRNRLIELVESPTDLTGLGILVSEYLTELEELRWDGGPNHITFCFDSITLLLQYVETDLAFRFLHVLTSRLSEYGVSGHFHLDPNAHDERTVATFTQLFSDVQEV